MWIDPIYPKRATKDGSELYDNCLLSVDALRGFYKAHQNILATINLSDNRIVDKYKDLLKEFSESWNRNKNMPGRDKMSFIKLREIILGTLSLSSIYSSIFIYCIFLCRRGRVYSRRR